MVLELHISSLNLHFSPLFIGLKHDSNTGRIIKEASSISHSFELIALILVSIKDAVRLSTNYDMASCL